MATKLMLEELPNDSSKSQRVYTYLRRRIRELDIPAGAPLRKNEIADACGVSRAPVNEAIARLAAEGLVDVFPQSGSFVSAIRVEDIKETMFIRMALEIEAVKHATRQADPAVIERLEANIRAQAKALKARKVDLVLFDDLDEELHFEIMGTTGSPRARHLLETARVILDRPRFHLTLPEEHRPEDTLSSTAGSWTPSRPATPILPPPRCASTSPVVAQAIDAKFRQIEEQSEAVA
jgi:DNA-binding GntR family transcriptional regulator